MSSCSRVAFYVLFLALTSSTFGCGWERNTFNNTKKYTFGALRGQSVVIPVPYNAARLVTLKLQYVTGGVVNYNDKTALTHWGCAPDGILFPASLTITDNSTTPVVYVSEQCGDKSSPDGNASPWLYNFGLVSWTSGRSLRVWYTEDYNNYLWENNLGTTTFTYTLDYDVQGLPCPVCNDSKVSGTEQCDSVKWCDTKVCACLDGSVNITGKNVCECPTLEKVDPQVFKGQPTLATRLSGTNLDSVDIDLKVPQMSPHRRNVSAIFVNPQTNEKSSIMVPLEEHPCFWRSIGTYGLQNLIKNAKPFITSQDTYYNFLFNILISATENITLAGHSTDRPMEYAVAFAINVVRDIDLESTITSLNPTLLWAYIAKARVNVPTSGTGNPTVYLEIVTVAAEDGFRIRKGTFLPGGSVGNVVGVSTPLFMYEMANGWERWNLTATLAAGSVCSTSYEDNFTLSYTIFDSVINGSATHSSSLTASLGGLENWCAQNSTITLNGEQSTYTSANSNDRVTRFFIGDTVYVRDHVVETALSIAEVKVSSAKVTGLAGTIELVGSTSYGYDIDVCPSGDKTWVCYHFVLDKKFFSAGESIQVASLLYVTLDTTGSRRSAGSSYQNLKVQTVAAIAAEESTNSDALPTGDSVSLVPQTLIFSALIALFRLPTL